MPAFTQEALDYPYKIYHIEITYRWRTGLVAVPVAGPDMTGGNKTPLELCKMQAAHGFKIVTWRVERDGVKPIMPSPEPSDVNQTLLNADVNVANPAIGGDGNFQTYKATGRYVYALLRPLTHQDGFGVPEATPVISQTPQSNTYYSGQFSQDPLRS